MSKEQTLKAIEAIEAQLALLKKSVGAPDIARVASKQTTRTASKSRGGSTEPIRKLADNGFFDKPKTDVEVVDALKRKALTFKRKFVAVTLMRLVRTGLLEREGNGKKDDPWKYKRA